MKNKNTVLSITMLFFFIYENKKMQVYILSLLSLDSASFFFEGEKKKGKDSIKGDPLWFPYLILFK